MYIFLPKNGLYSRATFLFLFFFAVPVAFRNVLVTVLHGLGDALSLLPFVAATGLLLFRVCFYQKILRRHQLPLVFLAYVVMCVVLFPFLAVKNYFLTPVLGVLQLATPLVLALYFSWVCKDNRYTTIVINFIVLIAVLNAIGGIIQFFYSSDLFGMISNRIYDGSHDRSYTKRAISFLASPQSLSVYLAFCLPLVRYVAWGSTFKIVAFILILFCGVLTGSKAFFVYLLLYISISVRKVVVVPVAILALSSFSMLGIVKTGVDTIDRVLDIPLKILNLQAYATFQIWQEFVLYPSSLMQVIFGRGLGVMSTSSQTFNNYKILNGSTESFFIQIYFELGLVGILLFCLMFFIPPIKMMRDKVKKPIALALIALTGNMMFSPALYGFSLSCLIYLIYSISLRDDPVYTKINGRLAPRNEL